MPNPNAVVSRIVHDPMLLPESTGIYGGGGFDFRSMMTPPMSTPRISRMRPIHASSSTSLPRK